MKLKDKIAVVTGAAGGIGHGIAKLFVQEGARVAIADLKRDAADETASELTKMGPGKAIGVEMDVTDEKAVNAGVEEVVKEWGGIDVLVSNAGIQIVHKIEDFPFDRVEEAAVDPSRRRVPDHQGLHPAYVQARRRAR